MRSMVLVAALASVLVVPGVTPTDMMNKAQAQAASQETLEAGLAAQLIAAAGNPATLSAIIAREQSIGRSALLARALARAATSLATAGNSGQAATLLTQAISIASGADAATQESVGTAAGLVVGQITNTDPASASRIAAAAANSGTTTLQVAYSAGQSNSQTGSTNVVGGGGTGQSGGTGSTTTTTRTTNTPLVVTPTTTNTVEVPVVPEPNPGQAGGSPT